jgi:hypothetical protein
MEPLVAEQLALPPAGLRKVERLPVPRRPPERVERGVGEGDDVVEATRGHDARQRRQVVGAARGRRGGAREAAAQEARVAAVGGEGVHVAPGGGEPRGDVHGGRPPLVQQEHAAADAHGRSWGRRDRRVERLANGA